MENNDKKPIPGRSADQYARQQEDIRATQTFGESSLDRLSNTTDEFGDRTSEERERAQGVEKGSGKPI